MEHLPEEYTQRVLRGAGKIRWDSERLAGSSIHPDLARILHVGALLEDDTAITVRHADSLGLSRSRDLAQFLPMWDEEEAEHGRALHFLLGHQQYTPPEAAPASISRRRRALSRLPLTAMWEPIGVPSLGRPVWERLFGEWMHDEDFVARIRMMDRVVDSIPHLRELHLMETFLQETLSRAA